MKIFSLIIYLLIVFGISDNNRNNNILDKSCISKKDLKVIEQMIHDKGVEYIFEKKPAISEKIINEENCCGLYFIKVKLKKGEYYYYSIPFLKCNQDILLNLDYKNGHGITKDSIPLTEKLNDFLNKNGNCFPKDKIDLIHDKFLYGFFNQPNQRVNRR